MIFTARISRSKHYGCDLLISDAILCPPVSCKQANSSLLTFYIELLAHRGLNYVSYFSLLYMLFAVVFHFLPCGESSAVVSAARLFIGAVNRIQSLPLSCFISQFLTALTFCPARTEGHTEKNCVDKRPTHQRMMPSANMCHTPYIRQISPPVARRRAIKARSQIYDRRRRHIRYVYEYAVARTRQLQLIHCYVSAGGRPRAFFSQSV